MIIAHIYDDLANHYDKPLRHFSKTPQIGLEPILQRLTVACFTN
jgi:hypothetical protein